MTLKLKLEKGVSAPKFQTEGAVGFDLTAHRLIDVYAGTEKLSDKNKELFETYLTRFNSENGDILLIANQRIMFASGVKADIPHDMELQVRIRSGIALKRGLILANGVGTVDPDYKGDLSVVLINTTKSNIVIKRGERIAQIVPKMVIRPFIEIVETLSESERGEGGFGSTGT